MRDLLTLTQWLSPAFPIGAFAFSGGLETAIQEGRVSDADGLERWLQALLDVGPLRSDVALLALAFKADDPSSLNETALALQPSFERREEMQQLGSAFCRTVRDVWTLELPDMSYPVAVGRAAALRGIELEQVAALFAQAYLGNLVSAAIRLVPLGQTEGQRVLARLQGPCVALGQQASAFSFDDVASCTFMADIASMRHETLSPRIFQS